MKSPEFVSVYPLDLSDRQIYFGDYGEDIQEAQRRSYQIGRFLHAVLSGGHPDTFTTEAEINEYDRWTSNHRQLESATLDYPDMEPFNEINFHGLNRHMLDLWKPLRQGGWQSDAERRSSIDIAQNGLALAGFGHYRAREELLRAYGGTEDFFEPQNQRAYGSFTGAIQEYDAGIILIEFMRRNPNVTVVPAPMQFERTNSRTNVDLLIIDFIGKRAVGAQVKTQVRHQHVEKYDKDRVVLIDGAVDLENVRVMRIKKGTSKEALKPWPGIIATKCVERIKTSGDRSYIATEFSRYLNNQKFRARQLVGKYRVDYRELTARIGERILDKL